MRVRLLLFTVLMFFLFVNPCSTAASSSQLDTMDKLADQSLQFCKVNKWKECEETLNLFAEKFQEASVNPAVISMDDLQIILSSYNEAIKTVQRIESTNEEKVNKLTKFRLAVDALQTETQPIWIEMEDSIMTAVQNLKLSVKQQDHEAFQSEMNELLTKYDLIYPSIQVDISPQSFQNVDAKLQYVDQYRPQIFSDQTDEQDLIALENDFIKVFNEMEQDDADPSLWWVIISTGSIIIMTLSYVGWKKYNGSKEKELSQDKTEE